MTSNVKRQYTAKRIVESLSRGAWLEQDVYGNWWLGMGTRGVGRGWRVPNQSAQAATGHDDVVTYDTGMGVIYIGKSNFLNKKREKIHEGITLTPEEAVEVYALAYAGYGLYTGDPNAKNPTLERLGSIPAVSEIINRRIEATKHQVNRFDIYDWPGDFDV